MSKTKIDYVEDSVNVFFGCTKCSPGCNNCYAEKMARRLKGMYKASGVKGTKLGMYDYVIGDNGHWNNKVVTDYSSILSPDITGGPGRMIFINSMSDTFHPDVKPEWITKLFKLMQGIEQHTWLVLTKRPQIAFNWYKDYWLPKHGKWPDNIWFGTTICDNDEMIKNFEFVMNVNAPVRFISFEPLLGKIDLKEHINNLDTNTCERAAPEWVIIGGESGGGSRAMSIDAAEKIIADSKDLSIPVFFKQVGSINAKVLGMTGKGNYLNELPGQYSNLNIRQIPE